MNSFETLTKIRAQRSMPRSPTGAKVPVPTPAPSTNSSSESTLRETFVVTHVEGLHARPCSILIRTLQRFKCAVTVQCGEYTANGRSILGLLALAAGCHSRVTFKMSGNDASAAMASVRQLFRTGFAEAYAS